MFKRFFERFKPCEHEYETIDSYYKEHLTEYINCCDTINAYARRKCIKCGDIKDVFLSSEQFLPELHLRDRKRKDSYIEYLKSIGFKPEIDLYI